MSAGHELSVLRLTVLSLDDLIKQTDNLSDGRVSRHFALCADLCSCLNSAIVIMQTTQRARDVLDRCLNLAKTAMSLVVQTFEQDQLARSARAGRSHRVVREHPLFIYQLDHSSMP